MVGAADARGIAEKLIQSVSARDRRRRDIMRTVTHNIFAVAPGLSGLRDAVRCGHTLGTIHRRQQQPRQSCAAMPRTLDITGRGIT